MDSPLIRLLSPLQGSRLRLPYLQLRKTFLGRTGSFPETVGPDWRPLVESLTSVSHGPRDASMQEYSSGSAYQDPGLKQLSA